MGFPTDHFLSCGSVSPDDSGLCQVDIGQPAQPRTPLNKHQKGANEMVVTFHLCCSEGFAVVLRLFWV